MAIVAYMVVQKQGHFVLQITTLEVSIRWHQIWHKSA